MGPVYSYTYEYELRITSTTLKPTAGGHTDGNIPKIHISIISKPSFVFLARSEVKDVGS